MGNARVYNIALAQIINKAFFAAKLHRLAGKNRRYIACFVALKAEHDKANRFVHL